MDFDNLMKARTTEVRSTAVRVKSGEAKGFAYTEPDLSTIKGYTVAVFISSDGKFKDTKIVG